MPRGAGPGWLEHLEQATAKSTWIHYSLYCPELQLQPFLHISDFVIWEAKLRGGRTYDLEIASMEADMKDGPTGENSKRVRQVRNVCLLILLARTYHLTLTHAT